MTDNRTTELLPCPFCGGEADVLLSQSRWGQSYTIHHDALGKCPAEYVGSMQFATEAEAIAAWNARAERTCHNTHENRWFKCSACGYGFTDLYAEDESDINEQPRYCPNCGRKAVDA